MVTKRISDRHHFCKLKFLWSVLQVEVSVGTSEHYAVDNICCIYAGFEVAVFVTGMLVDLSVAIKQVTVSVAIMQLDVFRAHMQVIISAAKMWLTFLL